MRPLRWWERQWTCRLGPLQFHGTVDSLAVPHVNRYWIDETHRGWSFSIDAAGCDPFFEVGFEGRSVWGWLADLIVPAKAVAVPA
jgi:hypothetical protein